MQGGKCRTFISWRQSDYDVPISWLKGRGTSCVGEFMAGSAKGRLMHTCSCRVELLRTRDKTHFQASTHREIDASGAVHLH